MKRIVLFLFVMTSLLSLAARPRPVKVCTLLQKDLLTVRVEDFSDPSLTTLCSPNDVRRLNEIFRNLQAIYEYSREAPLTREQIKKVQERLDQIRNESHGLVQVGSFVEDLVTGRSFQVSGVGTVIMDAKTNQFSILTAAHVVSGVNPFILVQGKKLSVKIAKIDYEKDLALLAYSENTQNLPLGAHSLGIIVTGLKNDFINDKPMFDLKLGYEFETVEIESYVKSDYGLPPALVLVSPWLSSFKSKTVPNKDFQVPRARAGMMTAPGQFPSGFSGSPILMAYRQRAFSYTATTPEYSFVIGGVLSLSGEVDGTELTVASSINQVREFLTEKKTPATQGSPWHLVGPYFMKWDSTQGQGLIYTSPRPIGNGVVVEGDRGQGAVPARLDPELQALALKLRERKTSTEETSQLLTSDKMRIKNPVSNEQMSKDWNEYELKIKSSAAPVELEKPLNLNR